MAEIWANDGVLGYCTRYDPNSRSSGKGVILRQQASVMLNMGGNYHLGSCGSASLTCVGNVFPTIEDTQNFVCFLIKTLELDMAYYFIANDSQLRDNRTVANLLIELGARKVDDSRNRHWGNSRMHLFVWNPTFLCGGAVRKFAHVDEKEYFMNPLWFQALPPEEKERRVVEGRALLDSWQENEKKYRESIATRRRNETRSACEWLIYDGQMDNYLKKKGWVKQTDLNGVVHDQLSSVEPQKATVFPTGISVENISTSVGGWANIPRNQS